MTLKVHFSHFATRTPAASQGATRQWQGGARAGCSISWSGPQEQCAPRDKRRTVATATCLTLQCPGRLVLLIAYGFLPPRAHAAGRGPPLTKAKPAPCTSWLPTPLISLFVSPKNLKLQSHTKNTQRTHKEPRSQKIPSAWLAEVPEVQNPAGLGRLFTRAGPSLPTSMFGRRGPSLLMLA